MMKKLVLSEKYEEEEEEEEEEQHDISLNIHAFSSRSVEFQSVFIVEVVHSLV